MTSPPWELELTNAERIAALQWYKATLTEMIAVEKSRSKKVN